MTPITDTKTHYRTCNLCEAMCGLVITHDDHKVLTINGDRNDSFSRGHICPKAVGLKDIYEDPNRLRRPLKRTPDGWQEIGWEQAFAEVSAGLRRVRAEHGANAIGFYGGNPSVHNSGTFLSAPGLVKAIGTKTLFSASSVDQFPHHYAAFRMFGHPLLLPVPDIDRTDFWLMLGANPIVSNGSIMTAPDVAKRLQAIRQRGGKVVVVDPRRTETALVADEHHFIRPGTDVLLLLGMTHTLFAENLLNPGRLANFTDGIDTLRQVVQAYTPERVAGPTGMTADAIRQLARELAGAKRAALYGRVGVSVQAYGGLCLWLINVLNVLTGNLDAPGGMMFTHPAIDILGRKAIYTRHNRFRSRVSQRPEFMGELPVSCLAEEIQTPGPGQIRAMVTSCGNPVLSTPNGTQLDTALAGLDFMVSVDIYLNETTRHANYILPPATGLETAHYDLTFHVLAIRNTAKYSEPLFDKGPDARYDWEIFEELRGRLEAESDTFDTTTAPPLQDPATKLDLGLKNGPYGTATENRPGLSLQTLRDQPHGIDLGPLRPAFPDRLLTESGRIQLAPPDLLADLHRVDALLALPQPTSDELLLISRRQLRDNNSWMHNVHRLVKGRNRCTLQMHPTDAAGRNLTNGDLVMVQSRVGRVSLPIEVADCMMPGVVCMPHGYGHHRPGTRQDVAQQHAGVSINDLTDERFMDELTGNAALSGVPVRIRLVHR